MVAYTYRMPAGIPGDINRAWACVVEPGVITPSGTTGAPTAYGVPLVVDQTAGNVGNFRTLASSDTAIYGLLARPYPTTSSQDPLGTSTPNAQGACDIMVSGYMEVLLSGTAAAVKGGPVYVWTAAATGSHIVGGFEAAITTGSSILVASSYFMGPADANGNVEIAFNV